MLTLQSIFDRLQKLSGKEDDLVNDALEKAYSDIKMTAFREGKRVSMLAVYQRASRYLMK